MGDALAFDMGGSRIDQHAYGWNARDEHSEISASDSATWPRHSDARWDSGCFRHRRVGAGHHSQVR